MSELTNGELLCNRRFAAGALSGLKFIVVTLRPLKRHTHGSHRRFAAAKG